MWSQLPHRKNPLAVRYHSSGDSSDCVRSLRKISIRLVVHTATPVPKKSASSVHTGHASPSAVASIGQSLSSRPRNRCRASLSKFAYSSGATGSMKFRKYSSDAETSAWGLPRLFKRRGKYFSASSKATSGAKKRTPWLAYVSMSCRTRRPRTARMRMFASRTIISSCSALPAPAQLLKLGH
jgi:hypothetical protein